MSSVVDKNVRLGPPQSHKPRAPRQMPFSLNGSSEEYEYRSLIQLQIHLTALILAYGFSVTCPQGCHEGFFGVFPAAC